MVKYTVKNYLNAVGVQQITYFFKGFIVAQTLIYMIVILSVIAMLGGFKYRAKVNSVYIKLL